MKNRLNQNIKKENKCNRGAVVGQIIGLTVAIVVILAIAVPVISELIETKNFTGTTGVVVGLIPLFLALSALVITTAILAG